MLDIDLNASLARVTATGLAPGMMDDLAGPVAGVLANLRIQSPFTGWVDLPLLDQPAVDAIEWAGRLPVGIDQAVVMGIGGSSLGPLSVYEAVHLPDLQTFGALRPPARRLVFLDNSDPDTVDEVLQGLDPRKTAYIAITKSGSTAETASQLMIAWERARQVLGEATARHFAFVTDPQKGDLRVLARRLGVRAFDVPPDVGGRFSVLSPVGLVPCAASGIDPTGLLEGARLARKACIEAPLMQNPAALLAAVAHLMDTRLGRNVQIVMTYSDRLSRIGAWFRQLWAESLGKRDLSGNAVGPTPLDARGATDQHSLLQLLVQGPPDKFVIFLDVSSRRDCRIPRVFEDLGSFGYLGGRSLGELIDAERRGTAASLSLAGTPSITITVDDASPATVGALFYMFEVATAVAGGLYRVDAYDQPGVEEGKKLACGLLGRNGFEDKRKQAEAWERSHDPAMIVGF